MYIVLLFVFFFKQKTAYEMRISDWSSDVCSSDLLEGNEARTLAVVGGRRDEAGAGPTGQPALWQRHQVLDPRAGAAVLGEVDPARHAGAELAGIEGGLQWIDRKGVV